MIVRFCAFITSTAHILFAHMHLVVLILDKLSLSLTAKSTAVRRPLLKYQLIGHVTIWSFSCLCYWKYLTMDYGWLISCPQSECYTSTIQCYRNAMEPPGDTARRSPRNWVAMLSKLAFRRMATATPHPKWKGKSLRVCLCARVFVFKWKKLKAGSLDKSGTTTCAVSIPPPTKAWGATVCFLLFSVWQRIILLSKYIVPILKF